MFPFEFYPQLIIRTPRLPVNAQHETDNWEVLLKDRAFMESVYIASSTLYNQCIRYLNGEVKDTKAIKKTGRALQKYWRRSCSRPTPFGLFSGCHLSQWSDESADVLANQQKRYTRIDTYCLLELARQLSALPFIAAHLLFYANNSLYRIRNQWRYIEYLHTEYSPTHQISAVSASDYLDAIINRSRDGATFEDIKLLLHAPDLAAEEVHGFINELIEAQILVSELEPAIHGDEPLIQIQKTLQRIYDAHNDERLLAVLNTLKLLRKKLSELDNTIGNEASVYKNIIVLLKSIGCSFDERRLFRVDLTKSTVTKGLPCSLQARLQKAMKIMNCFSAPSDESAALKNFAANFEIRYGNQTFIPLLEALDIETGISYAENVPAEDNILLNDLIFPSATKVPELTLWPATRVLQKKMVQLLSKGESVMELCNEDCDQLTENWNQMPASIHLLFCPVTDNGQDKLYIESCGGSSAINLLSRFAFARKEIRKICQDIAAKEQSLNPDIIFAAIAHISGKSMVNIASHPKFRSYEIPFLSVSAHPRNRQLPLQDIMIRASNGTIALFDKKNGAQIIPCLDSAHNYTLNTLPVYRFLCDLQFQGIKRSISFNWGGLQHIYTHLPRVEYEGIILSAASWRFTREDLNILLVEKENATALKSLRLQYGLPEKVVLLDDDNELPLDFNQAADVAAFTDHIRNNAKIELREFFCPAPLVKDENGDHYQAQILAPLINTNQVYPGQKHRITSRSAPLPLLFPPGVQWLYYKIYLNPKSSNNVLKQVIHPLVRKLVSQKQISSFFFIRYTDPDYHIRLRLKMKNEASLPDIINIVNAAFHEICHCGLISDLQIDTYKPEFSRYGKTAITRSETLFYYDSEAALNILSAGDLIDDPQASWLSALLSIDHFLAACQYSLLKKQGILSELKEAFGREFKADNALRKQLSLLYRQQKQKIELILERKFETAYTKTLYRIMAQKTEKIKPMMAELIQMEQEGKLDVCLHHLIKSHIHMMVNRLIYAQQREHELVLYDFLYQYYTGLIAKHHNNKADS